MTEGQILSVLPFFYSAPPEFLKALNPGGLGAEPPRARNHPGLCGDVRSITSSIAL
jgi:hypothetical protein